MRYTIGKVGLQDYNISIINNEKGINDMKKTIINGNEEMRKEIETIYRGYQISANSLEIKKAEINNVDFSKLDLKGIKLIKCQLKDCIGLNDTERVKNFLGVDSLGSLSDGYHTFNELYHHRALLSATICNMNKSFAWKSKKHSDGSMYSDMFIVGINTSQGQATYHYDIEPYWDLFKVKELEKAPEWDGHTPKQAIERIYSLCKEDK